MTALSSTYYIGDMESKSDDLATGPPRHLMSLREVGIAFGGLRALQSVTADVDEGEILAVLGPNGAGKTTLFNCITGLYRCEGQIWFAGRRIERMAAHRRSRLGIARTFQTPVLIESMTVLENVLLGADLVRRPGYLSCALRLERHLEAETRERARQSLADAGMAGLADRPAGELAHGLRKNVELVRAFLGRPRLLLLDEPASGLDHDEAVAMGRLVSTLARAQNVAVVVVEHNVGLVMAIADRVTVLDFGKQIALGTPAAVREDPQVIAAYLGGVAA